MVSIKQDDMDEDDDEDGGPPPGWEFGKLVNALPEPATSSPTGSHFFIYYLMFSASQSFWFGFPAIRLDIYV